MSTPTTPWRTVVTFASFPEACGAKTAALALGYEAAISDPLHGRWGLCIREAVEFRAPPPDPRVAAVIEAVAAAFFSVSDDPDAPPAIWRHELSVAVERAAGVGFCVGYRDTATALRSLLSPPSDGRPDAVPVVGPPPVAEGLRLADEVEAPITRADLDALRESIFAVLASHALAIETRFTFAARRNRSIGEHALAEAQSVVAEACGSIGTRLSPP